MNALQYTVIAALAITAALSVLLFDKRGKSHKPAVAFVAYLLFVQMMSLALAAALRADRLIIWLLILSLAVHTGSILMAGGNVSKVHHPGAKKPGNPAKGANHANP